MWVARNKDRRLFLFFKEKPVKKDDGEWHILGFYNRVYELDADLLPEVKWEDDEPTELYLKR